MRGRTAMGFVAVMGTVVLEAVASDMCVFLGWVLVLIMVCSLGTGKQFDCQNELVATHRRHSIVGMNVVRPYASQLRSQLC